MAFSHGNTLIVLLVSSLVCCDARLVNGVTPLHGSDGEAWRYLTKFGFDVGRSTFKYRFRVQQPSQLERNVDLSLNVFMDENWPDALMESDLCARNGKARQTKKVTLKADGSFAEWFRHGLRQTVRPHLWYFALSDCKRDLGNSTHLLEWEMELLQEGGGHYSVEMRGLRAGNLFNLLAFTGFLAVFYRHSREFVDSAGALHPVIWLLFVAMMLQYAAHCLHTVHLIQYSYDGVGFVLLDSLGQVLLMLAQVCQTSLLIQIGMGYTLLCSKLDNSAAALRLSGVAAFAHALLVAVGKWQGEAHYRYHENEGVVGWILLAMRLALFAWFLLSCQATALESGARLRCFLARFVAAGSLYFLAYPTMFVVFRLFAPYLQNSLMTIGLMVMQMAANVWLSTLFLTRGEYFKVSTLSNSCLPGGLKIGVARFD